MSAKKRAFLQDSETKDLIKEVKERPCIWESLHQDHNKPNILCKNWDEIEKSLKIAKHILNNKWRTLKRQMHAAMVLNDTDGFSFYQDMIFMKEELEKPEKSSKRATAVQTSKPKALDPAARPTVAPKPTNDGAGVFGLSDEQFFMSLLPLLNEMDPQDKKPFRARVLMLIARHLYNKTR